MRIRLLSGLVAVFLLLTALPVSAQKNFGPVQEFTGVVDSTSEVVLYTVSARAGQVLYAHLQATSGSLDSYLGLGNSDLSQILREDDDSGGGFNAALQYTVTEDGDYTLAVTRYDASTSGQYRLLVGLDMPAVLQGRARPSGDAFVNPAGSITRAAISLNGLGMNLTNCSVLQERPRLSGPEETRDTEHFRLHYTFSGADAVTPEYAQEAYAILDMVWEREIVEFGWPIPPRDCGEGGDDRYDVYLADTLNNDDAMGITMPEAMRGDNPHTDAIETSATYSSLRVDNDFDGDPNAFALLRATLAHEFHHAIQFGYDVNDYGGGWYYEASASWMETQVFPEEEDASPYVGDVFATPDRCVGSDFVSREVGLRIYGEWLLLDSIAQDYGHRAIQRLWELIGVHNGMQSLYVLADELHTTPQSIVQRYGVRNLLRAYPLASRFVGGVRVEALVERAGAVQPRQSGVEQLGVDYVLFRRPGVYAVEVDQPNLDMTLIGVNSKNGFAEVFSLGKQGVIDTTPYQYTYLMLLNTDQHQDGSNCVMTNWVLHVQDAQNQPVTTGEAKIWDATHFTAVR